jgi:hypothetical protein
VLGFHASCFANRRLRAASMMLEAVNCLALEPSVRSSAAKILAGIQAPDMLYAVLIAGYQLVAMVQPKNKDHALHPQGTLPWLPMSVGSSDPLVPFHRLAAVDQFREHHGLAAVV